MTRTAENEFTVQIEDDFNLQMIAESGQCFRWNKTADGGYRILHADRCLYIRQTGETEYCLDCGEDDFNSIWKSYFDYDEDYAGIREKIDRHRDPFLHHAAQGYYSQPRWNNKPKRRYVKTENYLPADGGKF